MSKLNKQSIALLFLTSISMTSCSGNNENSTSNTTQVDETYVGNRTISLDNENPIFSNYSDLGNYEYNYGIHISPPIGNIIDNTYSNSEFVDYTKNSELFTLDEVEQIVNNLQNQYDETLNYNSNEYEKYINILSENYTIMETEYLSLLQDISDFIEHSQKENEVNENKFENFENSQPYDEEKLDDIFETKNNYTHEENLDNLYKEALKNASENLSEFKPIQGQSPMYDEIVDQKDLDNIISKPNQSIEDISKITAENILKIINQNISLPSYTEMNNTFISLNYDIKEDKLNDSKLIISNSSKLFEMFILNISNLSEKEVVDSIKFRIGSILNDVSENNTNNDFNLDDKVLLVNIDGYIIFCISDINDTLLNFLQNMQ